MSRTFPQTLLMSKYRNIGFRYVWMNFTRMHTCDFELIEPFDTNLAFTIEKLGLIDNYERNNYTVRKIKSIMEISLLLSRKQLPVKVSQNLNF